MLCYVMLCYATVGIWCPLWFDRTGARVGEKGGRWLGDVERKTVCWFFLWNVHSSIIQSVMYIPCRGFGVEDVVEWQSLSSLSLCACYQGSTLHGNNKLYLPNRILTPECLLVEEAFGYLPRFVCNGIMWCASVDGLRMCGYVNINRSP